MWPSCLTMQILIAEHQLESGTEEHHLPYLLRQESSIRGGDGCGDFERELTTPRDSIHSPTANCHLDEPYERFLEYLDF